MTQSPATPPQGDARVKILPEIFYQLKETWFRNWWKEKCRFGMTESEAWESFRHYCQKKEPASSPAADEALKFALHTACPTASASVDRRTSSTSCSG